MKKVAGVLAAALMAAPAVAAVDYFPVTIDGSFSMYRGSGQEEGYTNQGNSTQPRLAKDNQDNGFMDWSGTVGANSGQSLSAFLAANPGAKAYLYVRTNSTLGTEKIAMMSIRSGNTGDIVGTTGGGGQSYGNPAGGIVGSSIGVAFRMGAGPYFSVGEGVDPALNAGAEAWKAPAGRDPNYGYSPWKYAPGADVRFSMAGIGPNDGGPYTGFSDPAIGPVWALEYVLGIKNNNNITVAQAAQAGQLVNTDAASTPILLSEANNVGTENPLRNDGTTGWYKVEISGALVNDIANNVENKGLFFTSRPSNLGAVTDWTYSNVGYYSKESGSGAYLMVTPEPVSVALLALGGLALLRRRHA